MNYGISLADPKIIHNQCVPGLIVAWLRTTNQIFQTSLACDYNAGYLVLQKILMLLDARMK
jgi:hypothetical protein